jgi:hypothetical protein
MSDNLVERVTALEARLDKIEKERKGGRPAKPILVKSEGVCGVEPGIDSATCPYATLYRRRQGCEGLACQRASAEYYRERK